MSVFSLSDVTLVRGGKTLLGEVTWKVEKGQHWALLGRNGSGKTLTLKVLCGYLWPTMGSVEVFGERFGQTDIRKIRKRIGWFTPSLQFQLQTQNYTVRDIVLSGCFSSIGLHDEPSEKQKVRAEKRMKQLACQQFAERSFSSLSTGEQKRVMLARALVAEPELLILDEPCTGLDFTSREEFLECLQDVSKAKDSPTLILVTHHVEEIMPCFTHCMMMKDCSSYQSGEKEEVLNSDSLQELLEIPFDVARSNDRFFLKRV